MLDNVCACVHVCARTQVSVLLPQAGRGEKRKGPSKGRKLRHEQERKAVREYRLGRGRGREGTVVEERGEVVKSTTEAMTESTTES